MKKRLLSILLLICMVASLLPFGAAAAETSSKSVVWVNPLYQNVVTAGDVEAACDEIRAHANAQTLDTPSFTTDEAAAKYLRRQMCKRTDVITFRLTGVAQASGYPEKLFSIATEHTGVPNEGDYLAYQYSGFRGTITSNSTDTDCLYELTIPYYTNADQEASVTNALNAIMPSISNAGGEYVRTKAIYDYICSNVTYDEAHLDDNDYDLQYTAYAALIQKTAVCQGYALLFYRMALEAGLDARIIASRSLDHAWDIVRNERLYYYMDSTWDAGDSTYSYFMCGQNDFQRHDALDTQYTNGTGFAERYPLASTRFVPPSTPLRIYYQPYDVTAEVNTTAQFSVYAEGEGLSYQWQSSVNNGKTWSNAGSTVSTIYCDVAASTKDALYRCVVTDAYGDRAVSRSAKLTVTGLRIMSQPKSTSVKAGSTVNFTVKAGGDNLRYQWQYKAPGGSWKNSTLAGNKTATLKIVANKSRNGLQYRCRITDGSGSTITSSAVTLHVLAITVQPKAVRANVGETATFTVKATGLKPTYQWQYKAPGGSWKNSSASSAKKSTLKLSATAGRDGFLFRCKIKDSAGNSITTKAVKLTARSIRVTTQPKSVSANVGETAKFTAKASGVKLSYQWQYRVPGGSWKNSAATGNQTATLKVSAASSRNGYQYRCKIKDSAGNSVTTKAVKLTVQKLHVTTQPKAASANVGEKVKFTAKASGVKLTYQWQYKAPGGSWKNSTLTGNKTATLKVTATKARDGLQYRCKIKDSAGSTVTTKAVKLSVQKLHVTAQPKSVTAGKGTTVKFTVKATGYSLSYQWQYKAPEGSWKNSTLTGCKTATLKVPAANSRNGLRYRCIITDSAGSKVTSNTVKLTVRK